MATKNEIIMGALVEHAMSPKDAYYSLRYEVGSGALVFTYNHNGARYPRVLGDITDPWSKISDPTGARKPHSQRTQHEMCLRMCYAVANERKKSGNIPGPSEATIPPVEPVVEDTIPVEAEPVEPTPTNDIRTEVERFRAEVARLRRFVADHGDFDPLDSMRACAVDGVKAIMAGVPVEGLLCSITASWPSETRVQAGIADFDYAAWGRRQPEYDPRFHAAMPYVLRLARAGVLIYLHGPAGTGKSNIAKAVAGLLDRDYHEMNLAGAMASAIRGKVTPQGLMTDTAFIKSYSTGAVLGAEELDASHPNVLTALNNGLANGHFANEVDGKVYDRSPDFVMVATGNSLMNGATAKFSGRMNIDGATKDRFRAGFVRIGNDSALEDSIVENILTAAGF